MKLPDWIPPSAIDPMAPAMAANPAFRASRGQRLPALVQQKILVGQVRQPRYAPIECPVGMQYVAPKPLVARTTVSKAAQYANLLNSRPARAASPAVPRVATALPGRNARGLLPWALAGLGADPADPLIVMAQAQAAVASSVSVAQKICDDLAWWTDADTKTRCANNVAQTKKIAAQLQASLDKFRGTPPTPDQIVRFMDLAKVGADQTVWAQNAKLFDTSNLLKTVAIDTAKDVQVAAGRVVDTAGEGVGKVAMTLVKNLAVPVLVGGGVLALALYLMRRSGARVDTKYVKVNT